MDSLRDAVNKHLQPIAIFVVAPVLPAGFTMTGTTTILLFTIVFICYITLSWSEWTAVWVGEKPSFDFKELFCADRDKLDTLRAASLPVLAGYGILVTAYLITLYLDPIFIWYPFILMALMLAAGLVHLQVPFQLLDKDRGLYSYEDINLKQGNVLAVVAMGQSISLIAVMIIHPISYCMHMTFNPCAAIGALAFSASLVLSSFCSLYAYNVLKTAKK